MSTQPSNYPGGDSPDVNQLTKDYEQLGEERHLRDLLYAAYKTDFEEMVAKFKRGGRGSANTALQDFMYVLMPMILEKTQYTLSIVGDQLDVLSDYRSMIAKAQSDFNKFSSDGGGTVDDYKEILNIIAEIKKGLNQDAKTGTKSGYDQTVLDAATKSEIKTALDALYKQDGNKASGALVPKGDNDPTGKGAAQGAQYLNTLWKESKDPKYPDAGEKLKTMTDQFNTVNTASSTISEAKQTKVQYESSAYQQQLGLFNNTLQARAKLFSALVQNQRSS